MVPSQTRAKLICPSDNRWHIVRETLTARALTIREIPGGVPTTETRRNCSVEPPMDMRNTDAFGKAPRFGSFEHRSWESESGALPRAAT